FATNSSSSSGNSSNSSSSSSISIVNSLSGSSSSTHSGTGSMSVGVAIQAPAGPDVAPPKIKPVSNQVKILMAIEISGLGAIFHCGKGFPGGPLKGCSGPPGDRGRAPLAAPRRDPAGSGSTGGGGQRGPAGGPNRQGRRPLAARPAASPDPAGQAAPAFADFSPA